MAVVLVRKRFGHVHGHQAHFVLSAVPPFDIARLQLRAIDECLVGLGVVPGAADGDLIAWFHKHFLNKAVGPLPVEIPVADVEQHLLRAVSTLQGGAPLRTQVVHVQKSLVHHPGLLGGNADIVAEDQGQARRGHAPGMRDVGVSSRDWHAALAEKSRVGEQKAAGRPFHFFGGGNHYR